MPTIQAFIVDRALDVQHQRQCSTTVHQQDLKSGLIVTEICLPLETDADEDEAKDLVFLKRGTEQRAQEPSAMLTSRSPAALIASFLKSPSSIRIKCNVSPPGRTQKSARKLHSHAERKPTPETSLQTTRRQQPLPTRLKDTDVFFQSKRHTRSQSTSTSTRTSLSTSSNPPKHFTYKLAAAYCGKAKTFKPSEHHFSFSSISNTRSRAGVPLPDIIPSAARLASGQDAVFITNVGSPSSSDPNTSSPACAFGVADGVGGWQEQGIDSADFANGLCMYMSETARYSSSPSLSPRTLLQKAYERVCADASITGGGSTACLGIASSTGLLHVANLGDSGFMQLRAGKVVHYSAPQTHAFNTPYQLSSIPPKMLAQMEAFGAGRPFSDQPGDAATSEHHLEHGDVVVFATDGVWDNVGQGDLLGVVRRRMSGLGVAGWVEGRGAGEQDLLDLVEEDGHGRMSLQTVLATDIVKVAKAWGNDGKRDGPFAKAFQQRYPNEGYTGGKPDDIAVVVAIAIAGDVDAENGVGATHGHVKL